MSEFEKELAKASGQVVTDTARDARKALAQLFGEAAQELAKMMGDRVRLWRFRNLMAIRDEVLRLAAERGLSPEDLQALPLGDAFRVADAASYEDDEDLQRLWARLIANAVSDTQEPAVPRAFVDLLKSLSPAEAAFLDLLWTVSKYRRAKSTEEMKAIAEGELAHALSTWSKHEDEAQQIAVQNLFRMRCIAVPPPEHVLSSTITASLMNANAATSVSAIKNIGEELIKYIAISVGGRAPIKRWRGLHAEQMAAQDYVLSPLGASLMRACAREAQVLS